MTGKKQVFRTHVILVTEGRFFLLAVMPFYAVAIFMAVRFAVQDAEDRALMVFCAVFLLAIGVLFVVVALPFLWPRCFAKLVVTDSEIIWRCLFLKSRRLKLSDIRYSDIKSFREGNVVRNDFYHTGFLYAIVSVGSIPNLRTDKYKCTKDMIIFPLDRKLCECLATALPEPANLRFSAKLSAYRRAAKKGRR